MNAGLFFSSVLFMKCSVKFLNAVFNYDEEFIVNFRERNIRLNGHCNAIGNLNQNFDRISV